MKETIRKFKDQRAQIDLTQTHLNFKTLMTKLIR